MADEAFDRRADVVLERPAVGEAVDDHLVAAGAGREHVPEGGTDGARRRWQLQLEPQHRPAGDRVPRFELLREAEQELVLVEPDDELDGAVRVERVRGERARGSADDHQTFGVGRREHDALAADRDEPRRGVELDRGRGCEIGKRIEHDARSRRANDRDHAGRQDREIDVFAGKLDRRTGLTEHPDVAAEPDRRPLPVGGCRDRRRQRRHVTSCRTRG
jgi:hypothetical protein